MAALDKSTKEYAVGIDIGGTFTDCVVVDDKGVLWIGKALSTPGDFSKGVMNALRDVSGKLGHVTTDELLSQAKYFFHACTVGENSLITRSGAKTGLITTKGFADNLLIMRSKLIEGLTESEAVHLSALSKPDPFVPRYLVEEVSERIDYRGDVLVQLDIDEVLQKVERLVNNGVESIAVCLLWSIANDAHEKAIAEAVRKAHPSVHVSLSSEVAPFLGEYERTATTVFNAYIVPSISAYLKRLQEALRAQGLSGEPFIMQAHGGVLGVNDTCKNAVGTIESGPAAGVVGSKFVGDLIGESDILATDMGGTTFKVGIISGGLIEKEYSPVMLRHVIRSPKIWLQSIGTGGGSIARVDSESGLLKVGPQGAGARPGPVCYGLGGREPTVSDADLVLGYLNENYFLGGRIKLSKEAASDAIEERIAKPLRVSVTEAASGICRIVNSHMSDLVRRATVERGYDPRDFVLFSYGGAAPVHAGKYAGELGIKKIVIPATASVHGATGLIGSDVAYQFGKSCRLVLPAAVKDVNHYFSLLCAQARESLSAAGFREDDTVITRSADMCYRFQVHELNVPFPPGDSEITEKDMAELCCRFDELYEKSYGKGASYAAAGREVVTLRVNATGKVRKRSVSRDLSGIGALAQAKKESRNVYFDEYKDFAITDIYDYEMMRPGNEIPGPAIIETPVTTIVVNPKSQASMDEFRNIVICLDVLGETPCENS